MKNILYNIIFVVCLASNFSFAADKLYECHNCGGVREKLSLCSSCRDAYYCDKECQKKHWPVHKKACKKADGTRVCRGPSVQTQVSKHMPNDYDTVIYVDGLPWCTISSEPTRKPKINDEHRKFMARFKKLTIDGSAAECKKIGQEAFDFFKEQTGDSLRAFRSLQACVNSLFFEDENDEPEEKRQQRLSFIEEALDGVGDENYSWIP